MKYLVLLALVLTPACVTSERRYRSSSLEYLYPDPAAEVAAPSSGVALEFPLRLGVAFAPGGESYVQDRILDHETDTREGGTHRALSEWEKRKVLDQVAEGLAAVEGVASAVAIPTSMLTSRGGFEDLDRVRLAFECDVIVLLSYDQQQTSASDNSAWTYWTLLGAYVVEGQNNQTATVIDAVAFHVPSRRLLFHATGTSEARSTSTPFALERSLGRESDKGYQGAIADLVRGLERSLAEFRAENASATASAP